MIEIEFNLHLAAVMGKKRLTLDIGDSISLPQLKARLGLTDHDLGILLINDAWASLDSVIKDGDSIKIYPFMEGG
jgi:molybdopterin converting factor small subunit